MSRDITPFGLRMPTELKQQVEAAAVASGRSINAEIVDRLRSSLAKHDATNLFAMPDGLLIDEVIRRYGARVQILVGQDVADRVGLKKRES